MIVAVQVVAVLAGVLALLTLPTGLAAGLVIRIRRAEGIVDELVGVGFLALLVAVTCLAALAGWEWIEATA